jgi:hypothetical protein
MSDKGYIAWGVIILAIVIWAVACMIGDDWSDDP